MNGCDREKVAEWLDGALEAEEAAEVEAHVRGCEACAREKKWLEAENELLARRRQAQPPLSPELWRGVEARLASAKPAPAPARRVPWRMLVPVALAVAAALLILVR